MSAEQKVQNLLQQASNTYDASEAQQIVEKAIQICNSERVNANLFAKVRLMLGDIYLAEGQQQAAVEQYQQAAQLDEQDGVINSPEIQEKLNSLIGKVTNNLQSSIDNNPEATSNERGLSSLLLGQIAGGNQSSSNKFGMLASLLSSGGSGRQSGNSGFSSLISSMSSQGTNYHQQQQQGGFNLNSLMGSQSGGQSGGLGSLIGGLMGGSNGMGGSGGIGGPGSSGSGMGQFANMAQQFLGDQGGHQSGHHGAQGGYGSQGGFGGQGSQGGGRW